MNQPRNDMPQVMAQRSDIRLPLQILFALLCLVGFVKAQSKPDGEPEKLSGAVKSVRLESAWLSGDGKKIKEGKRTEWATFTFNENGNLLELFSNNPEGSFLLKRISTYDEQGRMKEEIRYKSKDEIDTKIVHIYDDAGRKIESQGYFKDGTLIGKSVYTYDKANRLADESYFKEGTLIYKTTFIYYPSGQVREKVTTFKNGEIDKVIYIYSDEGSRAEHLHYKSKDVLEKKLVKGINTKEKSSGMVYYKSDGSPAWKWQFKYDDKSNVIEEEIQTLFGASKWTYEYEHDDKGNWNKQTIYQWFLVSGAPAPTPHKVNYRIISYYPQPYPAGQNAILEKAEGNSGLILSGIALIRQEPVYPQAAKSAHIHGAVIVEVTVDEIGEVTSARALSGHPLLKDAAVEAAQKWKFKPTLKDGLPTLVKGVITFNFNI
jgi:TonB family protein